jgi:hypothetical protein
MSQSTDGRTTTATVQRSPGGRFAVLRIAPFALLWAALGQSAVGDQFFRVGLSWHATHILGGVFDATLVGLAMALPVALFGLVGGVLVDRFNRYVLLVWADLARLVIVAILAVCVLLDAAPLPALLLITALLSAPGVIFMPAVQSILPELADGELTRLVRMDALILGTFNVVGIVGAAASGLLLSVMSLAGLLIVDAATFGVSAVLIWLARARVRRVHTAEPATERNRSVRATLRSAREGISFLRRDPTLGPQFFVYPMLDAAQFSIVFLLPAFLTTRGEGGALLYGVAVAALALGRILGLLLVSHTTLMHRRGVIFAGNFLVQGAAVAGAVAVAAPEATVVAMALVGLPAGAASVAVSSFVQTRVPRQMHGRAFAAVITLSSIMLPVGPIALGLLAAATSIIAAMATVAAVFVAGGLYLAATPAVRSAR